MNAELAAEIHRAGVKFGATTPTEINETSKKLGEIEFETTSLDHAISVWMAGNGKLCDIVITNEYLDECGAEEISARLTSAIRQAEDTVRNTLQVLQTEAMERSK